MYKHLIIWIKDKGRCHKNASEGKKSIKRVEKFTRKKHTEVLCNI